MMISVIIPSFNRSDDLNRCLESIRCQGYDSYQIIVVDDNSVEDLSKLMREGEVYIRNSRNYGPAYSRNLASQYACGDILLFLDSDSELCPGVLRYMERTLNCNHSVGCLGGCGPCDENSGDVAYLKGKYYDSWGKNQSQIFNPGMFNNKESIACDHLESACLAVRKQVFIEAGGFDPYWFYMGEDREFCLRVKRCGYQNLIAWQARAFHHERDLDDKMAAERQAFFLQRFFEVSLKLDGAFGALRWLLSNRKQLSWIFIRSALTNIRSLLHIYRRRGWYFLDPKRLDRYRMMIDAE